MLAKVVDDVGVRDVDFIFLKKNQVMSEVVDEAGVHGVGGNAQIFGNWTLYNVDIQGTNSQKYSIIQYFHTVKSTRYWTMYTIDIQGTNSERYSI